MQFIYFQRILKQGKVASTWFCLGQNQLIHIEYVANNSGVKRSKKLLGVSLHHTSVSYQA